jgi:dihydroorotate dehydrogenase electron transfer subunit
LTKPRGLEDEASRSRDAPPVRVNGVVIANDSDGESNLRLTLRVVGWGGSRPGQFVMLSAGPLDPVPRYDPLLPRPMAVYRTTRRGEETDVEILYKVTGRGTRLLAGAEPGDRVRLVGPLGNGFPALGPGQSLVLVGGGTGIASLFELAAQARSKHPVTVILGARDAASLMAVEDFEKLGLDLRIVTEDGSRGDRGLVTDVLKARLDEGDGDFVVHACGPTPMMRRCAEISQGRGIRCLVSLENGMACGFGVCLGCAVPLSEGGYGLVCRQGPVFESAELDWGGLP